MNKDTLDLRYMNFMSSSEGLGILNSKDHLGEPIDSIFPFTSE